MDDAAIKVLMAFGTRPEIIKLGPVYQQLKQCSETSVDTFWSEQHIELADGLLKLFNIDVSHYGGHIVECDGLAEKTGRTIERFSSMLRQKKYDWVVVQGDTLTAMAGAIAGFLSNVPVAHVEAGLRTRNLRSPWPEEYNRRVISLGSSLHLAPTIIAKQNLLSEGVKEKNVVITGNTVVDALNFVRSRVAKNYVPVSEQLRKLPKDKKLILVTEHRRENFGTPLKRIIDALKQIAEDGDKHIVFPVHLNPNVRRDVYARLGGQANIHLVEHLQYPDLVYLLNMAWVIVTDSGGIQEEAPTFNKHVIITRDTTERPEVVNAGFGHLVGCNTERITDAVRKYTSGNRPDFVPGDNPFGTGHAAKQIVSELIKRSLNTRASNDRSLPVTDKIRFIGSR